MRSIQFFESLVQLLRKTIEKVSEMSETDVIFWLDICSSTKTDLIKILENNSFTRAEKQKFQTCMTHLSYMQVEFEQYVKTGSGLQEEELEGIESRVEWRDVESAFQNRIKTGVIVNINHIDILSFMKDAEEVFKLRVKMFIDEFNSAKVNAEFISEFVIEKGVEEKKDIKYFSTSSEIIYRTTNLGDWFRQNIRDPILKELEEFQERDSGWTLKSIISLCINMNKFSPIRASSYIDLPPSIRKRRACINIQNTDNECFKWSILAALHPQEKNNYRVSKYLPYQDELSFAGIEFPVKLNQIQKFEVLNDISVNIYILQKDGEKYEVSPCHVTAEKREKHVNLLLIQDRYFDEKDRHTHTEIDIIPKYHYVLIKSLSRLLHTQVSSRKCKPFCCERCLHVFYTESNLQSHEVDCVRINKCRIVLPQEKNKILKFSDHCKSEKVPFVIYADIESLLKKTENKKTFQLHEAYSMGFYIKCSFDEDKSYYKSYRRLSSDEITPAEWFITELKNIADEVEKLYKNPVPMRLSDLEELDFQLSLKCHMCQRAFNDGDPKVRDHCHLTGR